MCVMCGICVCCLMLSALCTLECAWKRNTGRKRPNMYTILLLYHYRCYCSAVAIIIVIAVVLVSCCRRRRHRVVASHVHMCAVYVLYCGIGVGVDVRCRRNGPSKQYTPYNLSTDSMCSTLRGKCDFMEFHSFSQFFNLNEPTHKFSI